MDKYQRLGYEDRRDYLNSLSDEYGVSDVVVYSLAEMLGENEDFDGLIVALQDYSY